MGTIVVRLFLLLMHSLAPTSQAEKTATEASVNHTTTHNFCSACLLGPMVAEGPLEWYQYKLLPKENTNL